MTIIQQSSDRSSSQSHDPGRSSRIPGIRYSFLTSTTSFRCFFGLALLFAAPVFHAAGQVAARNGLLIAGALSVAGVIGPAVNHIALREIGIFGYAIVWPIVCVPLSKAFHQRERTSGAPSGEVLLIN